MEKTLWRRTDYVAASPVKPTSKRCGIDAFKCLKEEIWIRIEGRCEVLCQVDLKAVARTDVFNGSGNGFFETLASEIAENIGPSGK